MTIEQVHDVDWSLFFGCASIAFGPIFSLFFILIARRAQLVILAIQCAFLWLVAILVTSTLWQIIPILKSSYYATVILAVIIQEIFRYIMFATYAYGERAVHAATAYKEQLPLNDTTSSLAAGVGLAMMQSLMMYGSVLASSVDGNGVVFPDACPIIPLVFLSAIVSLLISILNIALMIYAFHAYRKHQYTAFFIITTIHLLASGSVRFYLVGSFLRVVDAFSSNGQWV